MYDLQGAVGYLAGSWGQKLGVDTIFPKLLLRQSNQAAFFQRQHTALAYFFCQCLDGFLSNHAGELLS